MQKYPETSYLSSITLLKKREGKGFIKNSKVIELHYKKNF